MRCPDCNVNRVFGMDKCILFIEVSSFQGVLNEGSHCMSRAKANMYIQTHKQYRAKLMYIHYVHCRSVVIIMCVV